ncbi:proline dehydrogenase [Pontibacillus yanchengensis]|uniref:Proline dehydrogenase n=2 Tax=Pontibacillus yanchengensis TaxID=462910 RepID=A0ACC7VKT9_9BACI|nr:proline dehydrogenase [Pontibacillus yanchengensis]MYL33705.1 proline dehydrogenase [Pontibacillus yanchengensis]MYL55397.1 proline dehydrogenase [Pontibacillus yanchengensis]
MEQLLRNFFLFLSKNKLFTKLARKYGLRFGAGRFVAGETMENTAKVIQELNDKGMDVTIDHLGEFVDKEEEARQRTEECIEAIEVISEQDLHSQLSLKLTSMGLDISEDLVMDNMRKILDAGKKHNVLVTIDMEDYERCGKTLEIFKKLRSEYELLGTVLQSYLYRTVEDIQELDQYNPNLRLVKGAYKESPKVAFPEKKDVDENFKKIIKMHLLNGNYTAVATHDDAMIEYTKELEKEYNISRDQFEFQMLYGIRTDRQAELVKEGYRMRIYVPYGDDWYGYFMRRLAERPANVAFVLKGVFGK